MSYAAAIENLSALIPELFSTPGSASGSAPDSPSSSPRRKFSLNEIGILCAALGDPQHSFPSVLIAGTNGKGSTASTLAAIAREAGLRVGLYTSPHLERVNERIKLLLPSPSAGAPGLDVETGDFPDIPDQSFASLYFRVHAAAEQLVLDHALEHLPSYFELLTALAFVYFQESKVDLAVLEVGMGGRLDATNIVSPILSVITDISFDHQEWLGSTIDLIAREKAGILRPNGVLVTLPQHPEANQALGEVATELGVRGISAAQYTPQLGVSPIDPITPYPIHVLGEEILVDSPLKGAHQHRNIALAVAAAVELAENRSFPITPATIERGIQSTRWPGRLERLTLPTGPEFVLDVAHNPAGAWALRSALNSENLGAPGLDDRGPQRQVFVDGVVETWNHDASHGNILIFACLRDKPLREMTQILFPIFDHIVLAPIHSPRATEVADLLAAAEATGVPSTPSATVEEAIQIALRLNPVRIVISGSVYLVGEARHILLNQAQAQKERVR
jgi:dihydrofolate synthase / folylpolyglutamate synthase